jgi:hypothetical protein
MPIITTTMSSSMSVNPFRFIALLPLHIAMTAR